MKVSHTFEKSCNFKNLGHAIIKTYVYRLNAKISFTSKRPVKVESKTTQTV